jgi:outer membrane protein TolC
MRLLQFILFVALAAEVHAADTTPPPRTIPSPETIAAMVPSTGKLGERELALLAISRRPQLEKLRGLVKVAAAQTLAAHDLPNPELRLSYAYDNDALIREPYIENETWTTNSQGSYDSLTNTNTLNGATVTREQGSISENRTRVIERQVTPGETQDVIVERVYETDSTLTSTSRERTKLGTTSSESERQRENRRLLYTNRRVIDHPNPNAEDTGLAAFVRFTLPHPWERRARIQRAAAEVMLAEADYFAEEDVVVRTVRAAFQELSMLEAKLTTQQHRKADCEAYRDWLAKQQSPQLGLDLAAARAKVYTTLTDIRAVEGEATAARQDLATYCGVNDASRIATGLTPRRVSSPASLDVPYLSEIATLRRADMLGTKARLSIALAQLSEAKAASIPFTTFLDLGYTHETTTNRVGDSNEFMARVGISIPIWEWTDFNKKREVPKAAALSFEQQINMQRSLIANEVSQAVRRLIAADERLTTGDKDLAALKADMKKSMNDSQLASANLSDVVKARHIEQEFGDLSQQMELSRYAALSAYNSALMALEKALGTRIEQALRRNVESR